MPFRDDIRKLADLKQQISQKIRDGRIVIFCRIPDSVNRCLKNDITLQHIA